MEKSPDAFRTISEVAEHLETPAHVLRFWESRFPQIRPVKRAGGRRYYRPADVALLTGIKRLLHDEGMTIRGVQKILREQGVRFVSGMADETSSEEDDAALEAALAASVGGEVTGEQMPHAEAESAQVIALQSALAAAAAPQSPEPGAEAIAEAVEDTSSSPADFSPDLPPVAAEDLSPPSAGDGEDILAETGAEPVAEIAASEAPPTEIVAKTGAEPEAEPELLAGTAKPSPRLSVSPRKDGGDDLPDLFSRLAPSAPLAPPEQAPEMPEDEPELAATVEIIDFQPSGPQRTPPPADTASKADAPPEEVAEAPMAVWAEEGEHLVEEAPPPAEVTPLPRAAEADASPVAAPMLRVTRIGPAPGMSTPPTPRLPERPAETAAPPPAEEPPATDPLTGLAARLRRTDPGSLTSSDRSTITVLRARARSLCDRLSAPHRPSSAGG